MAIKDYQAVLFLVLIILLHLSRMNMQDLLAFFHDTLHADLITLVQIMMMFTNMALILNTKWFDITTETFPEHVTTLILNIADKLDILSFAKKDLHINQLIKGLQRTYMGDHFPNNILSGVYINKLVSRNCALGQQTEAFVKVFGDLCRTVFVVVESPDVEEGRLYDIFYDLPLVPNHRPSLHEVEGEKKKKRRERFSLLSRRLETFTNSKLSTDAKRFAESGFFFCGKLDRVCCYECGIVISKWRKEDDPLLEHVRHSLDCPFVVSLLPEDLRHDIREQLQHARRNESSNRKTGLRDALPKANSLNLTKGHQKETKWAKKSARSPEYQSVEVRKATLAKFPGNSGVKIHDIANAGFYYTGMSDAVRCYFCDLCLRNWEYGDDPYMEHARYLPDCDYLRNVKGEDFIRLIQKETLSSKETKSLIESVETGRDQSGDKEKACTNILYTPAAQSVLELGYEDELVLAAIRKLNITDETKLTAIQILKVIFNAEEKGTDLVEKNIKHESQKYQSKDLQSPNEDCQYLLAINQRLKDVMLCKQCQARERNILLLPCTHHSLCHECANKNNLCPECWKPIKERVRTYMA